jgi:hypothetical protein
MEGVPVERWVQEFKSLGNGEKVILGAAVALFIVGFLPWYHVGGSITVGGVNVGGLPSISRNGWQSPGAIWSILSILIGLAMGALVVVQRLAKQGTLPPDVAGVTWPKIYLGSGVAAFVFVVIKLLNYSSNLSFGFYLGFIAVAALAAGGFLTYRSEMSQTPSGDVG